MMRFFEQDEKKIFSPIGRKVAKTPFWKHYLREALEDFGGKEYGRPKDVPENEDYDYRHAGNRKEVEKVLADNKVKFEIIDRDSFEKLGIKKGVNEIVYLITSGGGGESGNGDRVLFYSSIDPQGNIFRKKKFDSFKFLKPGSKDKEPELIQEVERSGNWKRALKKALLK